MHQASCIFVALDPVHIRIPLIAKPECCTVVRCLVLNALFREHLAIWLRVISMPEWGISEKNITDCSWAGVLLGL